MLSTLYDSSFPIINPKVGYSTVLQRAGFDTNFKKVPRNEKKNNHTKRNEKRGKPSRPLNNSSFNVDQEIFFHKINSTITKTNTCDCTMVETRVNSLEEEIEKEQQFKKRGTDNMPANEDQNLVGFFSFEDTTCVNLNNSSINVERISSKNKENCDSLNVAQEEGEELIAQNRHNRNKKVVDATEFDFEHSHNIEKSFEKYNISEILVDKKEDSSFLFSEISTWESLNIDKPNKKFKHDNEGKNQISIENEPNLLSESFFEEEKKLEKEKLQEIEKLLLELNEIKTMKDDILERDLLNLSERKPTHYKHNYNRSSFFLLEDDKDSHNEEIVCREFIELSKLDKDNLNVKRPRLQNNGNDKNENGHGCCSNRMNLFLNEHYLPGEGPCRKCGKEITNSSKRIFSKKKNIGNFGELSGQWHRECFRCHICHIKFDKNIEVYIHDDVPYCEFDFHVVNKSICLICNKFVEGKCFINEKLEKFHVYCLERYQDAPISG
ncbi:uncharacterized protein NDAI_0F00380 [Naumovozyma dairenensis CBS 421]|uniref:LIM zinc-binding domain-containing protein n=1 Tax=Naumovozyma dairenensis (strain ATCC 10597 / BCRC 20456 / CBS 421 / NBRC 0211 / NRRL Y-12639) TaxID=1071378 RepID=G0WC46_NAUDC|nr:hypothetical protein NDAI_0F00380 [Naumovozyma dairenensis CBS 421]CCD25357.1 hypothetical protein NDAI_0F00380 [Naumovozyma dairenensis CBS 421]